MSLRRPPPPRAVVDIGSNTVRMVVYGDPARAPEVLHNEKTVARLGRDLSTTGLIPDEAAETALDHLRRYARLAEELRIVDIETVATAAVRDAENGDAFLAKVRELGFTPRLLSGKEEARASAAGVGGAFPGAVGIVADLGGGSLELVEIDAGVPEGGTTLPLGTLRLGQLPDGADRRDAIATIVGNASFAPQPGGTLYLVGGTLRALGQLMMADQGKPLEDPHGFTIPAEAAREIAGKIASHNSDDFPGIDTISSSRAPLVGDAATLLDVLIEAYRPERLVFSAWGLREGLLMQRLSPHKAKQDPLISGVTHFVARYGVDAQTGAMIAGWISQIPGPRREGNERLRLVAALLALATQHIEPNLRRRHAYDWAMHKRWIGLAPVERAKIAAALLAQTGRSKLPKELDTLADADELAEGVAWGLAIRLLRRLASASLTSLAGTTLEVTDDEVSLTLVNGASALCSPGTEQDLSALATHLDRTPVINGRAIGDHR